MPLILLYIQYSLNAQQIIIQQATKQKTKYLQEAACSF